LSILPFLLFFSSRLIFFAYSFSFFLSSFSVAAINTDSFLAFFLSSFFAILLAFFRLYISFLVGGKFMSSTVIFLLASTSTKNILGSKFSFSTITLYCPSGSICLKINLPLLSVPSVYYNLKDIIIAIFCIKNKFKKKYIRIHYISMKYNKTCIK